MHESTDLRRELSELRNENQRLTEELRRSQRLETVGLLTEGIVHDFNNLLTPILGYAQLALMEFADDHPHRPWLEEIHGSANLARDLTEQLLVFARQQEVELRPLDLTIEIAQFGGVLKRLLRDAVELDLQLEPTPGPILGDRTQIRQVLLNLAINAQDAMPDGGTLTITTSTTGQEVDRRIIIRVEDDGAGMDEATRTRAFDAFFTTKDGDRGSGLGLSTVKTIVDQHRGRIEIDSELDRGTTFWLEFPLHAKSPESRDESRLLEANGNVVLLVEDDAGVRKLARLVLEDSAFEVLEADGPEAALRLARERSRPIDLLLTDLVMPKMSGTELFDRLSDHRPELRVLYMSGYGRGQPDCLLKPFSSDELVRRTYEQLTK